MEQLSIAMTGETVIIPYEDLKDVFTSEDDLRGWCTLHGLQFIYLPEKQSYKISKA